MQSIHRFLLTSTVVLALTGFVHGQSVTLPAEIKGGVGAWVIVAPEKIDGGKPKWRIDPGLQEVRLDLLLPPETLANLRGKVVTAAKSGRYKIEAWNAKGDVASDISTCWVVIGEPGPIPPDPKPPDVPPVVVVKHLSFIGTTTTTAGTVTDTGLRDYLKSNGITVHVLTATDPQIDVSKLGPAITKAGGVPCVVLQSADGAVLDQAKITTVEAVKSLVGKYVK